MLVMKQLNVLLNKQSMLVNKEAVQRCGGIIMIQGCKGALDQRSLRTKYKLCTI